MARISTDDVVETDCDLESDMADVSNNDDPAQNPASETSSDEEDDDEDQKETVLQSRAKELEDQIRVNSYDYTAHEELVNVYHQLADLVAMRRAFSRFHELYPLTEKIWLLWLKTEIPLASSSDERKYVKGLFNEAVKDYLSINIWLEYVQFATADGPDEARLVFEEAVRAAGLHVMQSSLIWDAYRVFEMAHFSLIKKENCEEWLAQVQRIIQILNRQLKVPLVDMDHTFVEFRVFAEQISQSDLINIKDFENTYRSTSEYLEKIMPFENAIIHAADDNEKLIQYYKYIDFEKDRPIRQNVLYERAVVDFALNPELWLKFSVHAARIGPGSYALDVCKKSTQNVTWQADLWICYMRTSELYNEDHAKITRIFEQSLLACHADANSQLSLWLCYLEHCRRCLSNQNSTGNSKNAVTKDKLEQVFTRACEHLSDTWGSEGDPGCNILQYWARIEATMFKNMEAVRKIWSNIMSQGHNKVAAMWLELIYLEQKFGDAKHIRKTYNRAINATKDWPQSIVQSWLNYERDEGTIETIMECNEKSNEALEKWTPQQVSSDSYNIPQSSDDKQKKKSGIRESGRRNENKRPQPIERKRKSDSTLDELREQKKPKPYEADLSAIAELRMDVDPIDNQNTDSTSTHPQPKQLDPVTESRTVFVSNLEYSVDEDMIKNFFKNVKDIRLVKDFKGRSKGFCYVELGSTEEVDETLKRDRERLNGRPVFISRCKTEKMHRDQAFRYSSNREQHKLFVKGLPLTATKEDLENLFAPHGTLKDIRMVFYRNGHFKGLAYIEFATAAEAARALLKTDNTEMEGHVLSVAISAPPQRNLKDSTESSNKEPLLRKSRLQLPLIPSVLQKYNPAPKTEPVQKTNADFRDMLLKK